MPKVLIPFEGKPMIQYLLDAVVASGVDTRPVIVTGHHADLVEQTLGSGYDYVRQESQLGTGHAVACAESMLRGRADQVMILYGDHPFVRASRIRELARTHEDGQCPFTLVTVTVDDFQEWRAPFADFSRIIRDADGRIIADVQAKDATPEQLEIREVNPALFCFNGPWLWTNLKKLNTQNAKSEYYLTDLVSIAIAQGACITSLSGDAREAMGLNTPEHLELAHEIKNQKNFFM